MWKLKVGEGGRWLMSVNNHVGRQHWEFDPDAGTPDERAEVETLRARFRSNRYKQSSDALMRMQMRKEKGEADAIPEAVKVEGEEDVAAAAMTTTLTRGVDYWCSIQAHDGHWPSESAGPLFFFPPLVMALYITGGLNSVLPFEHQREIKRYIYNHQNEDGGWGLHIEGHSTMFGSTLNYVALRLVGEGPDDGQDNAVARGRKWILDHGGSLGIPSWGKFWLAVLGVYDWAGCNPLPPEFFLLPSVSPIHPGKILCYARLVYMPMSYLYGRRFVGEITPLINQLRQELYVQPYHQINWNLARNTLPEDICNQHPLVQDILWGILYHVGEPILRCWPFSKLREKALKVAKEHIHYEDINSNYITIGCVEKILCMMACWVEDPNSQAYKFHLARIPDFFWVAEDGMKLQSFGSQMWDTAFSIQAILSTNLKQKYGKNLRNAHDFVKASQVRKNPSGHFKKMYRHTCKGAWTFSMQDHGWQVSDSTADGLKVAMLLSQMPSELVGDEIETAHLYDAVNVLLSLQSENGGFPAWEPERAYGWVERHVECTSSVIQSLSLFKKLYPEHRRHEIETCIERAIHYIIREQNSDGSWIGNWGVCFTYGTWFAVEALSAFGMDYNNCWELRRACDFLLSKQLPDGGWGESYLSNLNKAYTNLEGDKSNLVQTSWALLALIKAGQNTVDPTPIREGIKLVINSQLKDGDFPQQEMTGAFFASCSLNYAAYRNIFPIWALGEYQKIA